MPEKLAIPALLLTEVDVAEKLPTETGFTHLASVNACTVTGLTNEEMLEPFGFTMPTTGCVGSGRFEFATPEG